MARNPKPQLNASCEAHCIKEADLGKLEARIDNNENTGNEIKEALRCLVSHNENEKNEINKQFTTMTSEIAKMSATLEKSTEADKELLEKQNSLLAQMQQMLLDNQNLTNRQTTLEATLATQMSVHEQRYAKIKAAIESGSTRITKLEQHRSTTLALGAFIISLLTAAGVIAQIIQTFKN